MIIVQAADNNQVDTALIGQRGLAYNVITVGAIDDNKTMSKTDDFVATFSRYLNTGGCEKPDVVAPGNYFYSNDYVIGSGTSFATPLVTSAIAIMLQKMKMNDPLALNNINPMLIKAILMASCDRKVLDTAGGSQTESNNGITEKQGAGVINVERALEIIDNEKYVTDKLTNDSKTYYEEKIASSTQFTAALAWEKYTWDLTEPTGDPTDEHTNFIDLPISNLNLTVYNQSDGFTTPVVGSYKTNSSAEYVNIPNIGTNGLNNYFKFLIQNVSDNYTPKYALAWS